MFYLATPYSHPDPKVRHDRYLAAMRITARFIKTEWVIYSPIMHSYVMAQNFAFPTDFEFWSKYDLAMIDAAKGIIVCHLPGLAQSIGVQAEIKYAKENHKLVLNYEPKPEDVAGLILE